MALTVSTGTAKGRAQDTVGVRRRSLFRVTLDTAYPSPGGYAFDPKQFGHQGKADIVRISPRYNGTGATATLTRRFEYDHTNKKIVAMVTSTGVEVGNGIDVSGCILDIEVLSD